MKGLEFGIEVRVQGCLVLRCPGLRDVFRAKALELSEALIRFAGVSRA